ncbi:MAG: acyl-CoA dehydrogenase [Deltaproteobacteria bacterium]|nr:acyl-CoA dehydrogenase [Deltaproteobacteria bacterium]
MSYNLTKEQLMLQETAQKIAKEQLESGAAARDEKGEFAWDALEIIRENGLFACDFPSEYGGADMGTLAFCLAVEEISKVCATSALMLLVHELGSIPIMLAGNDEQKKNWLPRLATGEKLAAFAITESDAGSDVAGMRTTAEKRGDKYIINGTKQFISHADVADYICIAVVTDQEKPAHKGGLSIVVLEKGTPGFIIGKHEDKLGVRGSTTCEIILEDCEIPATNILANEGDGFSILMKTFDFTRPCVAAQAIGIAQGALDCAVAYAKERQQFGKPIIKLQGLNWMLAEMDTQTEAARQLVYKTAALFEKMPKDLERVPEEAIRLSAMCKLFAGDTAMKVTTDAVQVFGGYGYVKEFPVERMMRDAKITQIYEGTSQVQKVIIGSLL